MTDSLPVRRALLSVADKGGLVELARALTANGAALVSSGSTAALLLDAGVEVTPVSDVTGFPEMLEGRVKTLHPRVHAGILADKRKEAHLAQLREHGIEPFDLVVVNLYPFSQTVSSGAGASQIVEQIDIGGPALVRAAAKNFQSVGVVVSPQQYPRVMQEIAGSGGLSMDTRLELAREAFSHSAAYDAAIAAWFGEQQPARGQEREMLSERLASVIVRRERLRYGENPHQPAALYALEGSPGPLGGAEVLQGKQMSFNNWLDAEAARALVAQFEAPAAAIVKHHNPCGVALGPTLAQAYGRALECDRVSAFGGIVAFNGEMDEESVRAMAGIFTEVVVAPGFGSQALDALAEKPNLRVVRAPIPSSAGLDIRPIQGGALVQLADAVTESRDEMKVVTAAQPTPEQWDDLIFAWTVAARVKSNAIVLASGQATVAIGAGQMNRLASVDIAARHGGERARGSCLASDAFFPFRDGVDRAAEAGVSAIIQPGGSVRDEEVVAAADEHGIAMVFTGHRHFRH